jgi:hypothetical protein
MLEEINDKRISGLSPGDEARSSWSGEGRVWDPSTGQDTGGRDIGWTCDRDKEERPRPPI